MSELVKMDIANVAKTILEIQRVADSGGSPAEIRGNGVVLLKNFSKGTTGSGKPKFSGTIANIDELKFNVWNNSSAYSYFEQLSPDAHPHVVWIFYSLSKYGLVISDISEVDDFDPETFVYHKYVPNEVASDFVSAVKASGVSKKAIVVIKKVLHIDVKDAFCERLLQEYAAFSHHDNCSSGLLAHMTKCIKIYNGIKGAYSFLSDEKTNDLMVISLALHDVGKIYEMYDGVYQGYSFLTHRGLGFEHLLAYKDFIVGLYDEEFFYMVSSVLLQHHGEYGENPRTVYAYLVHLIDDMEAQLTSINDMIQDDATTADAAGTKLKFNGTYLNVLRKETEQ